MSFSNTDALKLALIPGAAESLERWALIKRNMGWLGMAKGVKYQRDALYVGIALTTIGVAGMYFCEPHTMSDVVGKSVVALGVGLSGLASKRLYDATSLVQTVTDSLSEQSIVIN
ncbi:MAG: hypothetical protein AAGG81_01380 [Chlamydiota bacterium]